MGRFQPFNYGKAISDGQNIRANALNIRKGVREEQGNAAVNALAQRGITGNEKYNMLSQSGFGTRAQTERDTDMERDVAKTEWLKSQASQVYDQATYEAMAQKVDGTFGKPGSTFEKFGANYADAKQGLDLFLEREDKDSKTYGEFIDIPNQPNFVGQKDSNGKWVNVKKKVDKTQALSPPTKKVTGNLQEQTINHMELEDNLLTLRERVNENPDQLTYWAQAGSAIVKMGEKMGIETEGGAEYLKTRQGILNYSEKVYTNYRRMVTGSQASKFELGELKGQAPTKADSITTMNKKIDDWLDDSERLRIRKERILAEGFQYAGTDDKGNALYKRDGLIKEISKIRSLKDVPSSTIRREQLFEEYSNGKKPKDFSAEERSQLKAKVRAQLEIEGYNLRRFR